MTALNLADVQKIMTEKYAVMKINPAKVAEFKLTANKIASYKASYDPIAGATHVPWWNIGIIHAREASLDFSRSLAQGDPWNRPSSNIPHRPAFSSFYAAAVDALTNCPPFAARWKDWSPGGTLTLDEEYNGEGYEKRGKPSPYIWAGTDQYVRGKYASDGVYDPFLVDEQLGCAGLMFYLLAIDAQLTKGNPNAIS
jgi:lysozyme family protein